MDAFEKLRRFQEDYRSFFNWHTARGIDVEDVIRRHFDNDEMVLDFFNHLKTTETIFYKKIIQTPEDFMTAVGLVDKRLKWLEIECYAMPEADILFCNRFVRREGGFSIGVCCCGKEVIVEHGV